MVAWTVRDVPTRSRYEIRDEDGELAGFVSYEREAPHGVEVTVLDRTLVYPDYQGQGIGSELVRAALEDIRRRGGRVVARCPHVQGWIERHPEVRDLVVDHD